MDSELFEPPSLTFYQVELSSPPLESLVTLNQVVLSVLRKLAGWKVRTLQQSDFSVTASNGNVKLQSLVAFILMLLLALSKLARGKANSELCTAVQLSGVL